MTGRGTSPGSSPGTSPGTRAGTSRGTSRGTPASATEAGSGTRLAHRIGPRGRLAIRQAAGELRLRGVEGDTVRITSDRPLDQVFDIEERDDGLELRQRDRMGFGIFGRGESVDLDIEAPHGAAISIDGQSVDVDASDLSGTKAFRTASGEVALHRLAGAVELETVSGDARIDGQAPVDVRAKSVSGDVAIRVPLLRRLDLGTTSGDAVVDAELRGEGPFAIRTISGDVVIVGRGALRIEAETITGDLASEVPARRETQPGRTILAVGRQGPTLTFRSVSGDCMVVAPRQAAEALEEDPMLDEDTTASSAPAGAAATQPPGAGGEDARRLAILRRLERGEIDVAEAGEQLGRLDEEAR